MAIDRGHFQKIHQAVLDEVKKGGTITEALKPFNISGSLYHYRRKELGIPSAVKTGMYGKKREGLPTTRIRRKVEAEASTKPSKTGVSKPSKTGSSYHTQFITVSNARAITIVWHGVEFRIETEEQLQMFLNAIENRGN